MLPYCNRAVIIMTVAEVPPKVSHLDRAFKFYPNHIVVTFCMVFFIGSLALIGLHFMILHPLQKLLLWLLLGFFGVVNIGMATIWIKFF